jgi:molybdopterin/thiamine biosynthesis adenylyltransferase
MKVVLYGVGAIGSNLFVSLIKQFPEWKYVGIDFDIVEARNLRTQAYFRELVGQPKAAALMAVGMRFIQKLNYTPIKIKITTAHIPFMEHLEPSSEKKLWIDCFDNSESRKILKELAAQNSNVELLHLGFSPQYSAECIWDQKYDVPNDVDQTQADICSMVDAVGFIQMFIGHVMMNINQWAETGKKQSFLITNKQKYVRL